MEKRDTYNYTSASMGTGEAVKGHMNGTDACQSCEDKLKQAHPDLAAWFRTFVKPKHNDCHISWSYRGKVDQEKAFTDRKSKLHFPLSAHNKSDAAGNPCAQALDFFELDFNGIARWAWKYFSTISEECQQGGQPIKWGGDFHGISDSDHFEMAEQPVANT